MPTTTTALATRTLDTSVGALTVTASDAGIRSIAFGAGPGAGGGAGGGAAGAHLDAAAAQLEDYLAGRLRVFDLTLDLDGVSDFDRAVYDRMVRIPHGEVVSYGRLAEEIGRPGAARAVGGACNRNPVPIVVPCHRVVAADGTLGGYGGGLATKRRLLATERGDRVPTGGWETAGA